MDEERCFTVGELADRMNVTVRTLQYYDREGLLTPERSGRGRRLYSGRDAVRLQQILALKFLGFSLEQIRDNLFSLDSPAEAARVLRQQRESIGEQIATLRSARAAIDVVLDGIERADAVDFRLYADIVAMLRHGAAATWALKSLDDALVGHVVSRFATDPSRGVALYRHYTELLDEMLALQAKGVDPEGDEAAALADRWWAMVTDFTGGDQALLPHLVRFNESKEGWDEVLKGKQAEADDYIDRALRGYFRRQGMAIPEEDP